MFSKLRDICGSRLGCIHEGQSETFNEGKQRDGNTKQVSSHAKLPGNWKNFFRNDDNKDELLQFLGQECVSKDTGDKVIVFTLLDGVVSSRDGQNTDELHAHTKKQTPGCFFMSKTP